MLKGKLSTSTSTMHFKLVDETTKKELAGEVELSHGKLWFRFDGYSDATSKEYGIPLSVEFYEGKLSLIAWADINDEEPTHTITLEGARETAKHE